VPEQLFANVASTTLTGSITSSQTSVTVNSSANFPSASSINDREFRAAFVDTATPPNILEYVAVTQVTGTTWTITRGVEDPSRFPAAARASGTRLMMMVTRGVLESFERRSRTVGHNVLDYGAVGNSSVATFDVGNDDTVKIQDAINDARSSVGQAVVIFPGRKTYSITDTLIGATGTQQAVQMVGIGSLRGDGIIGLPTIVWNGVDNGTMVSYGTTNPNITGALIRNLNIRGVGPVDNNTTDLPGKILRFWHESGGIAKVDSGSGLDEVWLVKCKGNAISVEGGGLTNWWIRGGRWDQIDGYALYVAVKSQSILSVRDVTYDNWGANFDGHSLGMAHFDGTNGGATALMFAHFDTFHPEVNSDPIDIEAGATLPCDRSGLIVCSIDPTQQRLMHNITITNSMLQGGSIKSRSLVLMQGGTTAQRKARLSVSARNIRGFNGLGNSSAATNVIIPIGGIPDADKSPYNVGQYTRLDFGPGGSGDTFGTEQPGFWTRVGNTNYQH
jgi:hypothetical protein